MRVNLEESAPRRLHTHCVWGAHQAYQAKEDTWTALPGTVLMDCWQSSRALWRAPACSTRDSGHHWSGLCRRGSLGWCPDS